jgi:hypothetical protein
MKPVEAQFILHPEKNKNRTGYADSQAGDIDNGISFVLS